MKKVALTFLAVYLLFQAFYLLSDINDQILTDIKGTCALISGILLLLYVAFSNDCPDKNHKHHHTDDSSCRVLVFCLIFGFAASIYAAPPAVEVEKTKWAAAEVVALNVPLAAPSPSPSPPAPSPSPQQKCERCQGTGKIKPDGRIEIVCPDCHGNGVITLRDVIFAVGQLNTDLAEVKKRMSVTPLESLPVNPPLGNTNNLTPVTAGRSSSIIHWVEQLEGLKDKAQVDNKPVFIFWTADFCDGCEEAKSKYFADPAIMEYLNKYFICARINASHVEESLLNEWSITKAPKFTLVLPDWSFHYILNEPNGPRDPVQFFTMLKREHSQLYLLGAEKSANKAAMMKQMSYGRTCDCARTGQCVCGSNCNCSNCPNNSRQYSSRRGDDSRLSRAIYYDYGPQLGSCGSGGGSGCTSCGW